MLKIDLLPRHFAIARTNKRILVGAVVFAILLALWFLYQYNGVRTQIAQTEQAIAEVKPTADEVRELEAQTSEKQGWLDPISDKIDFVEKADKTGEEYFDRFHSINEYIWAEPQMPRMSSFSITGGSSVQFTVMVQGTAGVGRFLLNLLRCPDLTNISYSGVPGGRSIAATGAGAAGFPQAAATIGAAGVEPGSPNEPISLQISATLTEAITTPTPPGGGAAAGGVGMGGPMMGPGMMGPGGMGMGGPMMGPGGVPAAPAATPESELDVDELME